METDPLSLTPKEEATNAGANSEICGVPPPPSITVPSGSALLFENEASSEDYDTEEEQDDLDDGDADYVKSEVDQEDSSADDLSDVDSEDSEESNSESESDEEPKKKIPRKSEFQKEKEIGVKVDKDSDVSDDDDEKERLPSKDASSKEPLVKDEHSDDDLDFETSSEEEDSYSKPPPGTSSSIKRDPSGKPLYMTVRTLKKPDSYEYYFICMLDKCGIRFEGPKAQANLQSHKKKHRENKGKPIETWSFTRKRIGGKPRIKVTCELCGKMPKTRFQLKLHLKKLHNVDIDLETIVSGSKFDYSGILQACELCKTTLPRKELVEHVKGHVGEEYTIRCPNLDCWFVCVTQKAIYTHLARANKICRHSLEEDIETFDRKRRTCPVCGFTDSLSSLKHHLLQQHETSEKNFPCPISGCEAKFTLKQSVVLHLGEHDVSRRPKPQPCLDVGVKKEKKTMPDSDLLSLEIMCDICKETGGRFERRTKLLEHYFTQHQIGTKFQCEHCLKDYFCQESLNHHVKSKHENIPRIVKNRSFECQDCGKVYKSRKGFIHHRIQLHGDPGLSCKFCTDTFVRLDALQEHIRVVHKGLPETPKEFPCLVPNCGKKYTQKITLAQHHRLVHLDGQRSFICETCGAAFKVKQNLQMHMEQVHLQLRKFICEICGASFARKFYLKRHNMTHTGERPFPCQMCHNRFMTKGDLNVHLKSHERRGAKYKPQKPRGPRKTVPKMAKSE